jgi:hypothetical protein
MFITSFQDLGNGSTFLCIAFNLSCFLQIPATITRILLNHFKWDKEKLMEKYYDSQDQDQLFSEARVVSPFRKTGTVKVKVRKFQNKQ